MGGSSKKSTVGYRYFMALHFAVCYGPVDRLIRILVGDRVAFFGKRESSATITVNKPKLFGGDKREGGLSGTAELLMGGASQVLPSSVTSLLPSPSPAFRGVLSILYSGQISANNPYVKPFAFQLTRILQGWNGGGAWYPEKAPIFITTQAVPPETIENVELFNAKGITTLDDTSAFARDASVSGTGVSISIQGFRFEDGTAPDTQSGVITWESTMPLDAVDCAVEISGVFAIPEMVGSEQVTMRVFATPFGEFGILRFLGPTEYRFYFTTGDRHTGNSDRRYITAAYPPPAGLPTAASFRVTMTAAGVPTLYIDEVVAPFVSNSLQSGPTQFQSGRLEGETGAPVAATVTDLRVTYTSSDAASAPIYSMNPAHILYQCLTEPQWGMGYPVQTIDDDSFEAAADTLFDEDFGLCMIWNRQEELGAFIRSVLDHCGGILYTDPKTGKFALKLLRGDYDPETLEVFDPTNIIALDDFQRVGYGDTTNEITVVYRDVLTNRDVPITVQDLANIQAQGGVVSQTRQYPGLPTSALAARVAQRDLISSSTPLAKGRMTINRSAWSLAPGGVFKLDWSKLGLAGVIMRVLGIDYGTLRDGTIVVDFAEDVFGLPASSYAAQEPAGWTEPDNEPAIITVQDVVEVPYRSLANELSAADLSFVDEDAAYFAALAAQPGATALAFDIYSKVGGAAYEQRGPGDFVPTATLDAAIDQAATVIALADAVDLDTVDPESLAIIGTGREAEWVKIVSVDTDAPSITVARGVLDTTPHNHDAGARIFFDDARSADDPTERATGETVDFKLATLSTGGDLDYTLATEITATAHQRQFRPYPPGNVQIDGEAYPAAPITEPFTVTWAHRDRLQQTAYVVEQDEASIGPEVGTTYSAYAYDDLTGDLLESLTGIAGTSWAPALLGVFRLRVEIEAVRDGVASWQRQVRIFDYITAGRITEDGEEFRETETEELRSQE